MSSIKKGSTPDTKQIRSRIKEYINDDVMDVLYKIYRKRGISNNRKAEMIQELLDSHDIPNDLLGPGTNRVAFRIDEYVFKFAMDSLGVKDNYNEFATSEELQPYVIRTYETCGLINVTEYVTLMSSEEFADPLVKSIILKTLGILSEGYLLGDVGYTPKNFTNWGYRDNHSIIILDYAYIYKIPSTDILCTHDGSLLQYTNDFTKLVCPDCHKQSSFTDIRRRISSDFERTGAQDTIDTAYHVTEAITEVPLNHDELEEKYRVNKSDISHNDGTLTEEQAAIKESQKPLKIDAQEIMRQLAFSNGIDYDNPKAPRTYTAPSYDNHEVNNNERSVNTPTRVSLNIEALLQGKVQYDEPEVEEYEEDNNESSEIINEWENMITPVYNEENIEENTGEENETTEIEINLEAQEEEEVVEEIEEVSNVELNEEEEVKVQEENKEIEEDLDNEVEEELKEMNEEGGHEESDSMSEGGIVEGSVTLQDLNPDDIIGDVEEEVVISPPLRNEESKDDIPIEKGSEVTEIIVDVPTPDSSRSVVKQGLRNIMRQGQTVTGGEVLTHFEGENYLKLSEDGNSIFKKANEEHVSESPLGKLTNGEDCRFEAMARDLGFYDEDEADERNFHRRNKRDIRDTIVDL